MYPSTLKHAQNNPFKGAVAIMLYAASSCWLRALLEMVCLLQPVGPHPGLHGCACSRAACQQLHRNLGGGQAWNRVSCQPVCYAPISPPRKVLGLAMAAYCAKGLTRTGSAGEAGALHQR